MKISYVTAHEILDSNGRPTIEVEVGLDDGTTALGQVPSGASTGSKEAIELRDHDDKRYFGKGVLKAVENVETHISQALEGQDANDQAAIDQILLDLDGTDNKSRLGANAMVGTSMAVCRAAALSTKNPLYQYLGEITGNQTFSMPAPMILLMEGGKHGNWATDIQEFCVFPLTGAFASFRETLRAGAEIFHTLGQILANKNYDVGVGFEGAYAPKQLSSNAEAFDIIMSAVEQSGYTMGRHFVFAIDIAASEFFHDGTYILASEDNKEMTPDAWERQVLDWANQYPIWSIEDPFDEQDWAHWSHFNQTLNNTKQVVGDDLVVTNVALIQQAIEQKAMNATLIKLNQIGTVTETLAAITLSQKAGFNSVISHRSGETNDNFIADLAVGTVANQCKFGGPDRGERLAKYNRLLRIENELR
ncbi:MAG: phosphopyruvate hydratase [Patescibacteria group bacterium]